MEHIAQAVKRTLGTTTPILAAPQTIRKSVRSIDWAYETPDGQTRTALTAAQRFCQDMNANGTPYWLTLLGQSGTGKTHLARKVSDWFLANISDVQYVPAPDVVTYRDCRFRAWQSVMNRLYGGDFSVVDGLSEPWLAVIDDIGAEHDPRKFGVSKLLEILDRRKNKWTVLTSNLDMQQIGEVLDVRIASRLIRNNSKVIQMTCADYNLRK